MPDVTVDRKRESAFSELRRGGTRVAEAANAWLALDDEGSCVAYAGEESSLPEVRQAAGRYRRDSGLDIGVVRIDVPLPAGSGPGQIRLI